MTSKIKNVLICPLDWGLGASSRCIPIIQLLLNSGANVTIAADNESLSFLKKQFPQLNYIRFPFAKLSLSPQKKFCFFYTFKTILRFQKAIKRENRLLQYYINEYNIDIVISDSRLGLSSDKAYCIYLSHYFHLKLGMGKFVDNFVFKLYTRYLSRFDECWIPDFEGEKNLSGSLSHPLNLSIPTYYINPISRFSGSLEEECSNQDQIDILAVITGDKSKRKQLQDLIISQLKNTGIKALLVGCMLEKSEQENIPNISFYPYLSKNQLLSCSKFTKIIISRSGYSVISDLCFLGRSAILVPEPCLLEQTYLAQYHKEKGHFYYEEQDRFNLLKAIEKSKNYTPPKLTEDFSILKKRISFLVDVI